MTYPPHYGDPVAEIQFLNGKLGAAQVKVHSLTLEVAAFKVMVNELKRDEEANLRCRAEEVADLRCTIGGLKLDIAELKMKQEQRDGK